MANQPATGTALRRALFNPLARLTALVCTLAPCVSRAAPPPGATNFETRIITAPVQNNGNQWNAVSFNRSFGSPPVVVLGPSTRNNTEQCVLRVRNVTTTGFEYQIDEWDFRNGYHPVETLHFLAFTEGVHQIGNQRWQAGRTTGANRAAQAVALSGFSGVPVVLAQVESTINQAGTTGTKGVKALKTRLSNVTNASFQVGLETQEADTGVIANESIGWIAVSQGEGLLDGAMVSAVRSTTLVGDAFTAVSFPTPGFPFARTNPVLIAQTQTINQVDPGELKMRNLSATGVELTYQEESSADTETSHTPEEIGYLVLGEVAGEALAKIETGDVMMQQANANDWVTVNLAQTYTNPVVVVGPPSRTNATRLTIRVQNVTSTSFQVQMDRWDHYTTQAHNIRERVSYLVMEAGTYAVGGQLWRAGRRDISSSGGVTQTFASAYSQAPAVFSQIGTRNDPRALQSRVHSITAADFRLEIQKGENAASGHVNETAHWVAIPYGVTHLFSLGRRIEVVQGTGFDHNFRTRNFSRMHADPDLFAAMQTKNDADPATIRWRYLFANRVDIALDEDGSPGADNTHTAETVAFLTVQGAEDSDGDGAPDDWEIANGFNVADPADGALDPDGDLLTNQMEYHNRLDFVTSSNANQFTGGIVTASVVTTNGFEINDLSLPAAQRAAINARVRINRNGGFAPISVSVAFGGAPASTTRGAASSGDYTTWTAATGGTQVTTSLDLTANSQSRDIFIRPVSDSLDEYREGVRMTVSANGTQYTLGSPLTADCYLMDAQDIAANEKLFVGRFQSQGGAVTGASGFATIILNGSNTAARISSTFNGLTTLQNQMGGAHIHHHNTTSPAVPGTSSGPVIYGGLPADVTQYGSLPPGQLYDYPWAIQQSGLTGQQIIDALFRTTSAAGYLYINVHTASYAGGEIYADFSRQAGSQAAPPVPATPALENLANDEEVRRDCARFLTQATFGPTEAEISALFDSIATPKTNAANRITAFTTWLNNQWSLPQTNLYDYHYAANSQEWNLRGQEPLLDGNNVNVGFPPNNPADWTRWSSTVGSPPIPAGRNKESYDPDEQNRRRGWWTLALQAKDQLRQRTAFALEQILVVSDRDGTIQTRAYGHSRYYDLLADAADGIRHIQPPGAPTAAASYSSATGGNLLFKELLLDVSKHPIMGRWLSSLQNRMATFDAQGNLITAPDENYAREIMQLFSIGLFQLWEDGSLRLSNNGQPIPTYFNDDIKELARVFTGWSFAYVQNSSANHYVPPLLQTTFLGSQGTEYFHPGYENPMQNYPFTGSGTTRVDYHDPGEKVLQLRIDSAGARVSDVFPAFTGDLNNLNDRRAYAQAEIDAAVNALANHPTTAPFISRLLIQRFVTSNPSRGYLNRVTQAFKNDGTGRRGNLRAVVNRILLDYEARSLTNVNPQTINTTTSVKVSFGKVKEPMLRYIQRQRAFGAKSQLNVADLQSFGYPVAQFNNLDGARTRLRYGNTNADLAQTPNNMPSVFNWYLPDYSPGGRVSAAGLVAPELQIMTENLVVRAINYNRTTDAASAIIDSTLAWPTGHNVSNLLRDTGGLLDNVRLDLSVISNEYRNYRGGLTATGNTGGDLIANTNAATWLVDRLDVILCSGALKAKYPYVQGGNDPRSAIIDRVAEMAATTTNPPSLTNAGTRVRNAVYLITSSPEYIVQK
jgi:uncharacterized protein (DUF1800 family)